MTNLSFQLLGRPVLFSIFLLCTITAKSQLKDTLVTPVRISDSLFIVPDSNATFPEGDIAWNKFLQRKLEKNVDVLTDGNNYGVCLIKFNIDTNGIASNITPITMKNTAISKIGIKAITEVPRWNPAILNHQTVAVYKTIKITFRRAY